jgi:hypothetical protein
MDHVSGFLLKTAARLRVRFPGRQLYCTVAYPGWKRREDSEVEGKSAGKGSCDSTENKNKNVKNIMNPLFHQYTCAIILHFKTMRTVSCVC